MSKPLPPYKESKRSEIPCINLNELLTLLRAESGLEVRQVCRSRKNTVILLPRAEQLIRTFFEVGQGFTAVNRDEQKAKLYGYRLKDENGKFVFIVSRAAYIYPAERRGQFVATSGANEDDFMEHRLRLEQNTYNRYETQYNTDRNGKVIDIGAQHFGHSQIIGEIHTHPGFGTFFSAIDHAANESTEAVPYAYLVCDPVRNEFLAMAGAKAEEAKIVFLAPVCEKAEDNGVVKKGFERENISASVSQVIKTCKAFLRNAGVRGGLRLYYDANGMAHVKFHARFARKNDASGEFEQAKKENARR